jgi:hypothetical protein
MGIRDVAIGACPSPNLRHISSELLTDADQSWLLPLESAVVQATRAFVSAFALIPDVVEIRFGPDAMELIGLIGLTTLFKIRRVCGLKLRWPEQPAGASMMVEVAVLDDAARWRALVGVPASTFIDG